MAELKVCNGKDKYKNDNAIDNVINYIINEEKTPSKCIGGVSVDMSRPKDSMEYVSRKYKKESGVKLRHRIISFDTNELTDVYEANKIGFEISKNFAKEYQTVYAVHENRNNLHIHFVSNAVSYIDGHRYRGQKSDFYKDMNMMKSVLRKHHIYSLYYIK